MSEDKDKLVDHVFTGPYKRCRCAVCMTRKNKMTPAQKKSLKLVKK